MLLGMVAGESVPSAYIEVRVVFKFDVQYYAVFNFDLRCHTMSMM